MLVREVNESEKSLYNSVVTHPLQSWEWGEFRKQTGVSVERVGFYENGKLTRGIQVSFHPIPIINRTAGYLPKGFMPDDDQLSALNQIAKKHQALFVKLEPNLAKPADSPSGFANIAKFLEKNSSSPGRPLFTKYTYKLDLTPSEDELFARLDSKTRYNVRVALKHEVGVFENSSAQGLEEHLKISAETTKRQQFYAHSPEYFRTMWQSLGQTGMMRIFNAVYQDTIIVSWIMFVFNGVLYYPYGASRSIHRNVMASNLMMVSW